MICALPAEWDAPQQSGSTKRLRMASIFYTFVLFTLSAESNGLMIMVCFSSFCSFGLESPFSALVQARSIPVQFSPKAWAVSRSFWT